MTLCILGMVQQRHHATQTKRTHTHTYGPCFLSPFARFPCFSPSSCFPFLLFWLRWLLSSRVLLMACPFLIFLLLAEVFTLSKSDTDDLPLFSALFSFSTLLFRSGYFLQTWCYPFLMSSSSFCSDYLRFFFHFFIPKYLFSSLLLETCVIQLFYQWKSFYVIGLDACSCSVSSRGYRDGGFSLFCVCASTVKDWEAPSAHPNSVSEDREAKPKEFLYIQTCTRQ